MANSIRVTRRTSLSSRIMGSILRVLFGLALLVGGLYGIAWNEGRSVHRIQALQHAQAQVVSVNPQTDLSSQNGKLIHASGLATTKDQLNDPEFSIQAGAIALIRTVKMYQWKETQTEHTTKNADGSESHETTYSYQKVWSSRWLNSSRFYRPQGHENPASMPYSSERWVAPRVTLGTVVLDRVFVDQIQQQTPVTVTPTQLAAINAQRTGTPFSLQAGGLTTTQGKQAQIGDLIVRFNTIEPQTVSVMGQLQGTQLQAFNAPTGAIELLSYGRVSASAMIQRALERNTVLTWLIRLGLFIALWVGLMCLIGPLRVVLGVIPFLGAVANLALGLAALILALVVSLVAIGVAWMAYRPALAGALFLAGLVIVLVIGHLKRSPRRQTTVTPPSTPTTADTDPGEENDSFIQR
jgi:hypothetical protein